MGAVTVTTRRLGLGVTAALLLSLGILDLVQHYRTVPGAALALSAARALPVLVYRRLPVEAVAFELAAVLGTALVTVPVSPAEPWPWPVTSTAALAAVGGLVASLGDRRPPLVLLGVVTVGGLLLAVVPGRGDWTSVVVTAVFCAIGVVAGDFVHGRRAMAAQLAEERQVSAAERELRSVVEERARIARELHDVVAHHMSMITVQAETARYRLADLPEPVIAEFTDIARLARGSLSELRGLLSALRDDGADPDRTPQPTLDDLEPLVARITAAGTPVMLTVDVGELPQVVQLAAYRTVQEALSNVVRHAGVVRTWVDITRAGDRVRVEVTNERPPGDPSLAPHGAGHGLVGLRERATLLGGTFEVDQPDGGWRVRMELPA
jgi:signal transduction histidine kinase